MPGPIVDIHPHIVSTDTQALSADAAVRHPVRLVEGTTGQREDLIAAMDDGRRRQDRDRACIDRLRFRQFAGRRRGGALSRALHGRRLDRHAGARRSRASPRAGSRAASRAFASSPAAAPRSVDASTLDDPRSYPVWELCGERGISICVQTDASGIPPPSRSPSAFRRVPIIVDHLGPPRRRRRPALRRRRHR